MMSLTCPYCGPRSEAEFRCGGESHIERPDREADPSDRQWAEYLFFRTNPKGRHRERWVHAAGCRQWFNLERDTVTHEIFAVYPMGSPAPASEDML